MIAFENLSESEVRELQIQCVAFRAGDFSVPVGNQAVRNYMCWAYTNPDDPDVPFDSGPVQEWINSQVKNIFVRDAILEVLPAEADASWRFCEWAETLYTPWASDLYLAVADAHQWLYDAALGKVTS